MNMFKTEGEYKPDSLIASNEMAILKEGIGLKPGQGILKRGTLIAKAADKAGYLAGKNDPETIYGILTDDIDTGEKADGENIPAVCYLTGVFNPDVVTVSDTKSLEDYEDDLKKIGIWLRHVQG